MGKMHQNRETTLRLFLGGDTMLGRGIDQILPFPADPRIYESYVRSAKGYVELAERRNGPIPDNLSFDYVWGDLLADLRTRACDLRLVNLETTITNADTPEPKQINYRMSPRNIGALTAAGIDACTLANNHTLDWGVPGLIETLATLERSGISQAGAGRSSEEAARPLACQLQGKARVLVIAFGSASSGIPRSWQAGPDRPGINLLPDTTSAAVTAVRAQVIPLRRPGDLLVLSLHWGPNWGYAIPETQRALSHALIDEAGVDLIFGHSSHHPKGIEIHRGKLIIHGAGDLINDYEGIAGYEEYRSDLGLAYVADFDRSSRRMLSLEMIPYRRRRFSLERARTEDAGWLAAMLGRESRVGAGRFVEGTGGSVCLLPARLAE